MQEFIIINVTTEEEIDEFARSLVRGLKQRGEEHLFCKVCKKKTLHIDYCCTEGDHDS